MESAKAGAAPSVAATPAAAIERRAGGTKVDFKWHTPRMATRTRTALVPFAIAEELEEVMVAAMSEIACELELPIQKSLHV